jgi:hypothetical protein
MRYNLMTRVCLVVALNVSAGTARFRQLSGTLRKTYSRREPLSGCRVGPGNFTPSLSQNRT